ncbi:MAG: hypothetical protein IJ638_02970 [Alphaproteobacteria bacterium]|nr:hypothetical protein [Alphaproteobacteria bacterium]
MKKILVAVLVIAYPFGLQVGDAYAKRKSSSARSAKKKKSSKRKNSVKSASSVSSAKVSESSEGTSSEVASSSTTNISETETETTTTNTQNTASAPASTTETASASSDAETAPSSTEVKDMSKDPKWEDFRICMQTSCAGSDEQPNNVECYKSINFDNVFMNCKMLVDENKREDFKNYFTGPFLTAEKKTFCEGDLYGGKFNETTGKCAITVKYTRPKYSGKQYKCSAESKSLTWYLDGRNYVCDADLFGVGNCYQDSANYQSAQIQKWTGVAQLVAGTAAGLTTGLSAGMKLKTQTKQVKNESTGAMESVTSNVQVQKVDKKTGEMKTVDAKEGVLAGVTAGLQAGSGMLSSGATSLATAMIMEKEKGNRIYGVCNLPNGETISEGNSIKLSW